MSQAARRGFLGLLEIVVAVIFPWRLLKSVQASAAATTVESDRLQKQLAECELRLRGETQRSPQ
jgi:hypothetical protein